MGGNPWGPGVRTALLGACLAVLALAPPAHAAFPGKNGKIAFSTNRDGNFNIYTINPDGTALSRLTDDLQADIDPRWSADGGRIAFMRFDPARSRYSVWLMNADGGGQQLLSSATVFGSASWSPRGDELAYADGLGSGVAIIDSASGRWLAGFSPGDGISSDPAWSPDGHTIAFANTTGSFGSDLFAGSRDPIGSNLTVLTATVSVHETDPAWSPDGRRIAYTDETWIPDESSGLRTMNADGTGVSLVPATHTDRNPEWSPDGKRLVVSSWNARVRRFDLVTLNPDGTGRTPLVQTTADESDPDWQPIPGPRRDDFKTAKQFCKAERAFLGRATFRQRYGKQPLRECVEANI
jgi:Tol biopolymer transport system component